jgi:hypothetical protein
MRSSLDLRVRQWMMTSSPGTFRRRALRIAFLKGHGAASERPTLGGTTVARCMQMQEVWYNCCPTARMETPRFLRE